MVCDFYHTKERRKKTAKPAIWQEIKGVIFLQILS